MSLISALFDNKRNGQQLVCHMDEDNLVRSTRVAYQKIVQCIQAHVASHLELTTIELRCVALAMIEERHADVMAKGITPTINWVNVLMRETMHLP